MTKGIVGIQNIFGIGGIGQPSTIDIDMYKKASEVSARVLPTGIVYDTFDIAIPISANYDCFPSDADANKIIFVYNNGYSNTGFANIDMVSKSNISRVCNGNYSWHFQSGCQVSASRCVSMYAESSCSRLRYDAATTDRDAGWTYTSLSPVGVGIVKKDSGLILLKSDGKLYSVSNITNNFSDSNISLLHDTSGILPASTTIKPMAIDIAQNILMVLTSVVNIRLILLDDYTVLGNITVDSSTTPGICHHGGRLVTVYRKNSTTATIKRFKNDNE